MRSAPADRRQVDDYDYVGQVVAFVLIIPARVGKLPQEDLAPIEFLPFSLFRGRCETVRATPTLAARYSACKVITALLYRAVALSSAAIRSRSSGTLNFNVVAQNSFQAELIWLYITFSLCHADSVTVKS
jgi:hypothetical protein